MSKKSMFGVILASIILSVAVSGTLIYFFLPVLYPSLNASTESENENIILQTKFESFDASASLNDTQTEYYYLVNETQTSFTIQNQSMISILFTGVARILLSPSFQGAVEWEIVIDVVGLGAKNLKLRYWRESASGIGEAFVEPFSLCMVTPALPDNTYTIRAVWRCSYSDMIYGNIITLGDYPNSLYLRSLWLQELKT